MLRGGHLLIADQRERGVDQRAVWERVGTGGGVFEARADIGDLLVDLGLREAAGQGAGIGSGGGGESALPAAIGGIDDQVGGVADLEHLAGAEPGPRNGGSITRLMR